MRLAILLLAAFPAMATVVTLERDGTRVAGEVCRFRAGDAENPFKRWLGSQEVTCAPAGSAMEFPEGPWNVFGRIDGVAVSDPVLVEKAPSTLTLSLHSAATITTSRSGIVYAPRRAVAYPLSAHTTVPAGEELWLLAVEKAMPVALHTIPALEAGTERNVDASGAATGVLGWLQIPKTDRAALEKASGISAPIVRAGARDADPLPPLARLHGAFVFVRGVEAGEVELDAQGAGWLPARRRVVAGAKSITTAADPLVLRGSSTLIVHWSADPDLPAHERALGACDETAYRNPQYEVTLSWWADEEAEGCAQVRKETFAPEVDFGSFAADGLVPGPYRVEVRFGKLPPVRIGTIAAPFDQKDARIQVRYETMDGSLTLGGEPMPKNTVLELPSGIGFAAAGTGEYFAVVRAPISIDGKIEVTACDGSVRAIVFADRSARMNSRFDIDVPDNTLTFEVTDTFTREPLRGATVRYEVMSIKPPPAPIFKRRLVTSDEGRAELRYVAAREIHASVTLAGYEQAESDPFTMPDSGEKHVSVQLVPVRGNQGRIVSSRPFESATVYWFLPSGRRTERAELGPDGTFTLASPHTADETMAVVSASHPLWVRRSPAVDLERKFELPFPEAPVRNFDVTVRTRGVDVGLTIGGVGVPFPVLGDHHALRDLPPLPRGRTAVRFRDILETGPIEAVAGTVRKRLPPGVTEILLEP